MAVLFQRLTKTASNYSKIWSVDSKREKWNILNCAVKYLRKRLNPAANESKKKSFGTNENELTTRSANLLSPLIISTIHDWY